MADLSIGYKIILLTQNIEKVDEAITNFTQKSIDATLNQLENETLIAQKKKQELLETQEKLSSWEGAQKVSSIATSSISILSIPFYSAGASIPVILSMAFAGIINIGNELLNLYDSYQTIGSWLTNDPKKAKEYGETIHQTVSAICFFTSLVSSLSYGYQYFWGSDLPPVQQIAHPGSHIQASLINPEPTRGKKILDCTKVVCDLSNMTTNIGSVYYKKQTSLAQGENKKIQHHLQRLQEGYEQHLERLLQELKTSSSSFGHLHLATSLYLENIKLINQGA
jgi:hypothetical protein